jgi:predicted RND superfamily exporter protein
LPGLRFQTSIYDLAIEDLPESVYYRQFKKMFGSEEMILVAAKGNNLFAPQTFERLGALPRPFQRFRGFDGC